jgi:hypothetical protein
MFIHVFLRIYTGDRNIIALIFPYLTAFVDCWGADKTPPTKKLRCSAHHKVPSPGVTLVEPECETQDMDEIEHWDELDPNLMEECSQMNPINLDDLDNTVKRLLHGNEG